MRAQNQRLDPDRHSSEASEFEAALRERIIGQESVIRAVVDLYQVFCTGMCPQGRPVGNLLFLGPTGSGKTRVVEAAASSRSTWTSLSSGTTVAGSRWRFSNSPWPRNYPSSHTV